MHLNTETLLDGMNGIVYLTEPNGTIVGLGRRNWNDFARRNGGVDLIDGKAVVGRNLFDFIRGDAVQTTYRRVFHAVLTGIVPIARIFSRCDSPDVRRELWISVSPINNGKAVAALLVQSLAVSERQRPAIDLFAFEASRSGSDPTPPVLAMCSFCQQVRYPCDSTDDNGLWMTAEEYYHRGGSSHVRLSHGLCPPCFDGACSSLDSPPSQLH